MTAVHVEVLGPLNSDEVARVALLVEAATESDGVRPLSEHVMLHLRHGGDRPVRNVLAYVDGDTLAGYGHLDVTDEVAGASAEIVVHPQHRQRGIGRRLAETVLAEAPDDRLRLWAHGGHPAAGSLARSMGFRASRALWQMRRSLHAALPAPIWPAGVAVRPFRPGDDDEAWLRLNATAFRDHPEQGRWTVDDLRHRIAEPWFDPEGFFVAERGDRMVGFHWTKVHGGGSHGHDSRGDSRHDGMAGRGRLHAHDDHGHDDHGHDPIGEVYVVGVDPAERGTGLGKALTLVGLRHLRQRGLSTAMLYVDADNTAAIGLYTSLGFTRWETDVMFSRA